MLDIGLENDIVRSFDYNETLTTKKILERLKKIYDRNRIEEDTLINLLVLSQKFSMSSEESEDVKWTLLSQYNTPLLTNLSRSFDDEDSICSTPSSSQSQIEPPIPFKSMSLEHIYSVWTELSSKEDEQPNKRIRENSNEQEKDIFKKVRTTIL
ncbi:unnamed protein product [Rhizopus stolonifer]